jgi:hypothetical protein
MKAEEVANLKVLFDADHRTIALDLRDVRLADRDVVKFLRSCEMNGMKLENCPAYVREWIDREEDIERQDAVRTPDIGGHASTREFAEAVTRRLQAPTVSAITGPHDDEVVSDERS